MKVLPVPLPHLAVVFQKIQRDGPLPSRFLYALFVINVHVQVRAVLLRQRDSLVVDQRRVLHGRNTGPNGILDSLRIVCMRCYTQPKFRASSTAASSSSGVNSVAFGLLPCVSTAPVDSTLM